MSVLNENQLIGASGAGGDYEIEQSLRFNDDDSSYLSRTPSSAGNRKTWTWSGWVKRGSLPTNTQTIFMASNPSSAGTMLRFVSDKLVLMEFNSGVQFVLETNRLFRDTSAWYHIVINVDTTQSTASNRLKMYINGTEETSFLTETNPNQNYQTYVNTTNPHYLGVTDESSLQLYFDGYLSEVNFIDGLALTPDSFGETGTYGEWKAKSYAGGYGTNGFNLKFENASSLGNDSAGSNNWTPNNLAATDQMVDSPTNNFCTFDGAGSHLGVELSEGNLHAKRVSSSNWHRPAITNFDLTTNKCYWEVLAISRYIEIGIVSTKYFVGADPGANSSDAVRVGTDNASGTYGGGLWYVNAADSGSDTPIFVNGQVLMMAYDPDTRKLFFGQNGTWYDNNASATASPSSGGTAMYTYSEAFAAAGLLFTCGVQTSHTATANFGSDSSFAGAKTAQGNSDSNGIGDFYYAPPSGFLALCTANLPDVDVIPSEHFNTVIYSGNGASPRSLTGINFQPDLVWNKARNVGYQHDWADSVRGGNKILHSNSTGAEDVDFIYGYLDSFDTDGFTMKSGSTSIENWNESGKTYVAWNWKAGGTASSNTNGSITSSVSANPSAGFSIVSYTGTGANATVGHGLSVAPEMIIIKKREVATSWMVYNATVGNDRFLYLDLTNGQTGTNADYWNNTTPSSSVISFGNYHRNNSSSEPYIAYAFHSVESYSKVGSYTGNGSTDGTFVHCGFKPAYVMVKRTDAAGTWRVVDASRSTSNVTNDSLSPNESSAELVDNASIIWDLLSNGFKCRSAYGDLNASGGTYIFYAVAESPFKNSNAR
jgi:hypothetical protein